jgi:hypothetical protein
VPGREQQVTSRSPLSAGLMVAAEFFHPSRGSESSLVTLQIDSRRLYAFAI